MNESSEFSKFIREASPEEKERVFTKVIDDSIEMQNKGGTDARSILKDAADAVQARAILRDVDTEKSMARAVNIFNAITGREVLSEVDGWMFMVALKIARAQQGKFHLDDYTDAAAYIALAAECAARAIEDENL